MDRRSRVSRSPGASPRTGTEVTVVHGISQQVCGPWRAAMMNGLAGAGFPDAATVSAQCVVYGDLLPGSSPPIIHETESAFVQEQASSRKRRRRPRLVHAGLRLVDQLPTFWSDLLIAGLGERLITADLEQVRRYFTDPIVRSVVRSRLADAIGTGSAVLVGHSFGSVVAYEALCAHPEWPVRMLITLGSPLGLGKLIFSRLSPSAKGGLGRWPGSVDRWVNISDPYDVVCLEPRLAPRFGFRVEDHTVDNSSDPHDLSRYIAAPQVCRAIAEGLGSRAEDPSLSAAHPGELPIPGRVRPGLADIHDGAALPPLERTSR